MAKIQSSDCIYFTLGRKSASKYSRAVAAFRLYYSLLFDDSPGAECQQASTGTGLAGGGGCGGGLLSRCRGQVHSFVRSLLQDLLNHASNQPSGLEDSQNIYRRHWCAATYLVVLRALQSRMKEKMRWVKVEQKKKKKCRSIASLQNCNLKSQLIRNVECF